MICVSCGKVFEGNPSTKFCEECRVARHRQAVKDSRHNRIIITHCIICGAVIPLRKRYCKECAHKSLKQSQHEFDLRNPNKGKDYYKAHKKEWHDRYMKNRYKASE